MHEVSLVADLIDACERTAAGRPVERIRIRHASSLPEESLRQAFALLTTGGSLAGVVLETETFAVTLDCACGFSGALGHDDLISSSLAVCPSCGTAVARERTAEIELLELVTSPPANAARPD